MNCAACARGAPYHRLVLLSACLNLVVPGGQRLRRCHSRSRITGSGESTVTRSAVAWTVIRPCGVGTLPLAHSSAPRLGATRAMV